MHLARACVWSHGQWGWRTWRAAPRRPVRYELRKLQCVVRPTVRYMLAILNPRLAILNPVSRPQPSEMLRGVEDSALHVNPANY